MASTALRRNFRWPVQCGHCCALAWQSEEFAAETIRLCADAGIAIVALPMCNMYLQGRNPGHTPRWRGSPWSTSFAPPACRSRLPSGESGELPAAGSSDLDASAPMKRRVPPAGWRYSITLSVLARIAWDWLSADCVLCARTKGGSADTLSGWQFIVGGRDGTPSSVRLIAYFRGLRPPATATAGGHRTAASGRRGTAAGNACSGAGSAATYLL